MAGIFAAKAVCLISSNDASVDLTRQVADRFTLYMRESAMGWLWQRGIWFNATAL
jgi:hypothetical protein